MAALKTENKAPKHDKDEDDDEWWWSPPAASAEAEATLAAAAEVLEETTAFAAVTTAVPVQEPPATLEDLKRRVEAPLAVKLEPACSMLLEVGLFLGLHLLMPAPTFWPPC